MDAYEPFLSVGLAIAAGLLIGLEREQSAPVDRAAASNTVVKAAMAGIGGGKAFGRRVAAAFGAMLAAGGAGLAVAWLG